MAILQDLSIEKINEAVGGAVERLVPAAVAVCCEGRWINMHSRMVSVRNGQLLIETPISDDGASPHEFVAGETIGMNFKLKHHKHIYTATVIGLQQFGLSSGMNVPVLAVEMPKRMQRLQRRAYVRAEVPANRIVRAAFWLGGRESEPKGGSSQNPVWSGQVMNISAGGFQLAAGNESLRMMEMGDTVGVRLAFGATRQTVYADAQFRHSQQIDQQMLLGFQFVGMGQDSDGRSALQFISERVQEFQRINESCGKKFEIHWPVANMAIED